MTVFRYGVFRLAQIWTVVGDDGVQLGFSSRKLALDAAESIVDLHHASGMTAELLIQDELGFVRPAAMLRSKALRRPAKNEVFDASL